MAIFLFSVTGHDRSKSGLGLLPGIALSQQSRPEIRDMKQGSLLLLKRPDGKTRKATMATYVARVPTWTESQLDLSAIPIIPVLSSEFTESMVPVGTEVYLDTGEQGKSGVS
jgi:hypothetical protein